MQTVYLKVVVTIADDVDPEEVISECDYEFDHEHIIDYEILEADKIH